MLQLDLFFVTIGKRTSWLCPIIDALFYCMLASNKRDSVNNEFSDEFWLYILYTSNATGLTGLENNRVSEY